MVSARTKPPAKPSTRYEDDLYTWVVEQVALLQSGRLLEIDALNIAEELADVAKAELRALRSALAVLLMHLLKWDHQASKRSRSWMASVNEQRRNVRELLEENPGLKSKLAKAVENGYASARDRAVAETNLDYDVFPEACPYSFDEIMSRPIVYEKPALRRKKS